MSGHVMFSDEAVERAAFVLYKDDHWGQPTDWPTGPFSDDLTLEEFKADYIKLAKAVIAAFTGIPTTPKPFSSSDEKGRTASISHNQDDIRARLAKAEADVQAAWVALARTVGVKWPLEVARHE